MEWRYRNLIIIIINFEKPEVATNRRSVNDDLTQSNHRERTYGLTIEVKPATVGSITKIAPVHKKDGFYWSQEILYGQNCVHPNTKGTCSMWAAGDG